MSITGGARGLGGASDETDDDNGSKDATLIKAHAIKHRHNAVMIGWRRRMDFMRNPPAYIMEAYCRWAYVV